MFIRKTLAKNPKEDQLTGYLYINIEIGDY